MPFTLTSETKKDLPQVSIAGQSLCTMVKHPVLSLAPLFIWSSLVNFYGKLGEIYWIFLKMYDT